ncbi:MAG: hypothetical protein ABIH46_09320 [Chloroflexota bacterium]
MAICTQEFMRLGSADARMLGLQSLVLVSIPHPFGSLKEEQVRQTAASVVDGIVSGLTQPASPDAAKTEREAASATKIEAPGSLDAINELFHSRNMTDGLPIVPPTEERVLKMLKGVSLEAKEVIGLVAPRWGMATVEKIAVNAVMAGCLPSHLPILIAATKAMVNEKYSLYGVQTTTNPVTPMLVVNGPIAREIGMNSEGNCLGQGNRANACIGRAVRLILTNIGGGVPGVLDKATLGQPGKYIFCFAENEEKSPWPPLHVERGFKPTDSTVTVFHAGGTTNLHDYPQQQTGLAVLRAFSHRLSLGGGAPLSGVGFLILGQEHAHVIAGDGYSKDDIKRFIFENARLRASGFTSEVAEILPVLMHYRAESGPRGGQVAPDQFVPIVYRPVDIFVVVAGGGGGHHSVFVPATFGGPGHVITQLIE